jgi:hypothetical protein
MWELGGSKHMKIDDILRFLYENGRLEQVGMSEKPKSEG